MKKSSNFISLSLKNKIRKRENKDQVVLKEKIINNMLQIKLLSFYFSVIYFI